MKYLHKFKAFERFGPETAPAPATTPAPGTTPAPDTRPAPSRPQRPRPAEPIETPSEDPGPMALKKYSEMDVVDRLEMELMRKGESLSDFYSDVYKKNKKRK